MSRWMLLLGLVLLSGCAGQRARVIVTRVNGEPSVSLEFEPTQEKINEDPHR